MGRKVNGKRHEGKADQAAWGGVDGPPGCRSAPRTPPPTRRSRSGCPGRSRPRRQTWLTGSVASTSTPTTFRDRVSTSSAWPRQSNCLSVAASTPDPPVLFPRPARRLKAPLFGRSPPERSRGEDATLSRLHHEATCEETPTSGERRRRRRPPVRRRKATQCSGTRTHPTGHIPA